MPPCHMQKSLLLMQKTLRQLRLRSTGLNTHLRKKATTQQKQEVGEDHRVFPAIFKPEKLNLTFYQEDSVKGHSVRPEQPTSDYVRDHILSRLHEINQHSL